MPIYNVNGVDIYANNAVIGVGVDIEPGVVIGTPEKPIDTLVIGDHVYIGKDCHFWSPTLAIMDYVKIHNHTMIYGRNKCYIGYNSWFGQNCIIDCEGGVTIGHGVGAGAYSQLWSHIRHGDTLIGNKYLSFGRLKVDSDVWFVGHCVVSPIHAKKKSMALVGSVITKDMEENHIYGGSPAKDLTDKLGAPFADVSVEDRLAEFNRRLDTFYSKNDFPKTIVGVTEFDFSKKISQFNVAERKYLKLNSPEEIAFMKFLLPEAKFIPTYACWCI